MEMSRNQRDHQIVQRDNRIVQHESQPGNVNARATYDPELLERRAIQPQATFTAVEVRIPCFGPLCDHSTPVDWVCDICESPLHYYTRSDNYFYCECGGCPCAGWTYSCAGLNHGPGFANVSPLKVLDALDDLMPVDELNILILGRTGVGKSTWINAFVNYLAHRSLDDALCADKLSWIIPFAFRTYSLNSEGEFEDIKISAGFESLWSRAFAGGEKIGRRERDGTRGGSATQNTTVHRVHIGRHVVRLIDTPGIGDTRGASKDQENLADILSVLRTYSKIHGILILLKPNEQRLDLMFKFCVQELLTHLHRDAAHNIAFGFTNTRGTNYLPGDTFDPLQQLLHRFKDVDISLRRDNVYCFDSESFRFLAAHKIGHDKSLGHLDENRASWEYSVSESKRLLDHFREIRPHQVDSTVNLYETRYRIVCMTQPMAAIAETIRSTILINADDIQELTKNETRKKDLESLLKVRVKVLLASKVDRPRTTCSHEDCVEHDSTGVEGIDGRDVLKTVYKAACHSPCFLTNVKLDDIGNQGLRGCAAMHGRDHCQVCGHHWLSHLHIDYEIQEGTKEVNDPEVERNLKSNTSFRERKELSIAAKKRLVVELKNELAIIKRAAAHFSNFLKRNAIMPYNDATLEYLDRLIKEETAKVAAGGSRDKLDNLVDYRNEYQQQVLLLDEAITRGGSHLLPTQERVQDLMKGLYSLKHYGQNLYQMRVVLFSSQAMVRREMPQSCGGQTSLGPASVAARLSSTHCDSWAAHLVCTGADPLWWLPDGSCSSRRS